MVTGFKIFIFSLFDFSNYLSAFHAILTDFQASDSYERFCVGTFPAVKLKITRVSKVLTQSQLCERKKSKNNGFGDSALGVWKLTVAQESMTESIRNIVVALVQVISFLETPRS